MVRNREAAVVASTVAGAPSSRAVGKARTLSITDDDASVDASVAHFEATPADRRGSTRAGFGAPPGG
jgi:hypothetical protein